MADDVRQMIGQQLQVVAVLDQLAEQQLREFLVSSPLYHRVTVHFGTGRVDLSFPAALSKPCDDAACRKEPTTTWKLDSGHGAYYGVAHLVTYQCVHCGRAKNVFWVIVQAKPNDPPPTGRQTGPGLGSVPRGYDTFTVFKIGQWPSWSIEPAKEVKRTLDAENLELYKKGLVCMSQSYGIGALGYFRRVVENAVNDLLNLVEEAAQTDNDKDALAAVEAARKSHIADEKLKLIADVVPASLRPGAVNPFARLYDDYSRGIHALSDAECLEIASDMRDALEYVFGNIRDRLDQARAFKEKITKRNR